MDADVLLEPKTTSPTAADPPLLDIVAVADDYDSLVSGLIARRHELGLPQHVVDDLAGTSAGYVGKIECRSKRLGVMSLSALLPALGVRLALVRTEPWHKRQRRVMGSSCGPVRLGPTPTNAASQAT